MGIKSGKLRSKAESRKSSRTEARGCCWKPPKESEEDILNSGEGWKQGVNKEPGLEREARPVEQGGIFTKRVECSKS